MGIEKRAFTGSANLSIAPADELPSRRPYMPPELRHLGSVRQLTLSGTGSTSDGPGSQTGKGTMMSSREVKDGIAYLDDAARAKLAEDVLRMRLANYRYKEGVSSGLPEGHRCLGFIIEDAPADAPFVVNQRQEVDVYGFASAILAALQEQQKTIARLERELAELRGSNELA